MLIFLGHSAFLAPTIKFQQKTVINVGTFAGTLQIDTWNQINNHIKSVKISQPVDIFATPELFGYFFGWFFWPKRMSTVSGSMATPGGLNGPVSSTWLMEVQRWSWIRSVVTQAEGWMSTENFGWCWSQWKLLMGKFEEFLGIFREDFLGIFRAYSSLS